MQACCKNSADGLERGSLEPATKKGNKCSWLLDCGFTYGLISHQPEPAFIGAYFVVAASHVVTLPDVEYLSKGYIKDFMDLPGHVLFRNQRYTHF